MKALSRWGRPTDTREVQHTSAYVAKKQLTDPININASLFTCSTDSRGKAKISWREWSPGVSMSQHEGYSPVQAKGSSRLLYSPTLSPLERGCRLLWNSTTGLKVGYLESTQWCLRTWKAPTFSPFDTQAMTRNKTPEKTRGTHTLPGLLATLKMDILWQAKYYHPLTNPEIACP